MKKRMYKVKKRWVVTGIAVAAFLSPGSLIQADETPSTNLETNATLSDSSENPSTSLETLPAVSEESQEDIEITEDKSEADIPETVEMATDNSEEPASENSEMENSEVESPDLPQIDEPKEVQAHIVDTTDASYTLLVKDVPSNIDKVYIPTWSAKDGQDDIKWYEAEKQVEDTYRLTVNIRDHGYDTGHYSSHVYGKDETGKNIWLGQKLGWVFPEPKAQAQIIATTDTSYTISVSDVPSYFDKVYIPTWSAVGDQDDIKWYEAEKQADDTYRLTIDIKNHGYDTGHYSSHVYGRVESGKNIWLGQKLGKVFPTPKAQAQIIATTDTSYTISVGDVPSYFDKVYIPTWSAVGDQDDIKWYEARKQADGTYRLTIDIKNHGYDTGHYSSHVYGRVESGKNIWLGQKLGWTFSTPKAQAKIIATTDTSYTISVSDVPSYFGKVYIPTWSAVGDQDDIKWYEARKQADGTYRLTIDIKNHGYDTGHYSSHVYGRVESGKNIWLGQKLGWTFSTPKAQAKIIATTDTSYTISVSDVPSYFGKVYIPTWSAVGDQDDIKWYEARKQADGTYRLTIDIKNHGYDTGHYSSHVYGRVESGKNIWLGQKLGRTIAALPNPTATLSIENMNHQTGTFDVIVSNLKSVAGVKLVQLPTWSEEKGQDDIKWYTANKQADGTYKVTIRAIDHQYRSDKYNVHLYVTNDIDQFTYVSEIQVDVEVKIPARYNKTVNGKTFTLLGGFTPTDAKLRELADAIRSLEAYGYSMGFVMEDARTKQGIEYRADQSYYSASTIKGPYVASLTAKNPSSINQSKSTMLAVLNYSSNDGYINLRRTYGSSSLYSWAKEAGLSESKFQPYYPYLTPRDLQGLWDQSYQYFTTNRRGQEVAKWFEKPNLSPIKSVLGSTYKTRSKAGWIGEWGYHAANDAGIVHTLKGDYIMTIMSNADGKLGLLNPAVRVLNELYKQI